MKHLNAKLSYLRLLLIPAVALSIFFNQLYRQQEFDLSVWKGGGMGMFAGTDGPGMRFVHIFGTDTVGARHPITRLTVKQQRLKEKLLVEPRLSHFRLLSCSILRSDWWTTNEFRRITVLNDIGVALADKSELRNIIAPNKGHESKKLKLKSVTLNFYKTRYDRDSSFLSAERETTFRLEKC